LLESIPKILLKLLLKILYLVVVDINTFGKLLQGTIGMIGT